MACSLCSQGIVLIHCLNISIPGSQDSLAVVSEDVLLVPSDQHGGAVEATGQSIQPGHVQSAGAVAVWHREAPGKKNTKFPWTKQTRKEQTLPLLHIWRKYYPSQNSWKKTYLSHLFLLSASHCNGNSHSSSGSLYIILHQCGHQTMHCFHLLILMRGACKHVSFILHLYCKAWDKARREQGEEHSNL